MTTLEINSREPQAGRLFFPVRLLQSLLGAGGEETEKRTPLFSSSKHSMLSAYLFLINNQGKYY